MLKSQEKTMMGICVICYLKYIAPIPILLLFMGDFNYPDIDWTISHGQSSSSQHFVDSVEECFFTQHVTEDTCNEALLDLVFTSEPDMIDRFPS